MKKFAICCLFLALAAFIGLPGTSFADNYKGEYKLSVVPAASSGWGKSAQRFADLVRDKTNGRINIKVYPGGQLFAGKQTSEFPMLRNGAIDFALASTINWSPQVKELNLPALPFFIASEPDRYKAMDAIMAGQSGKMMRDAIESKGVKILGWGENGFRELTTSKGPVASPDDLKGMKIRVVGSPIFTETFRALGANPVNMNWSEATTGFQQGVVDGQENPTNGINIPLHIWDYHKHHSDWHYLIDPLLLGVNPKVWDSFTPEDQALLLEAAAEAELFSKALSRVGMDDGTAAAYLEKVGKQDEITDPYATMEQHGMVVTRITPEQLKAFYEQTRGVRDDWTQKIGPDLVKAAQDDMASVR
ncbi:MAG: DctP family TRAP transporter solute-binding subunit [Desulfovibrio sp.]|nr:DctP family TRAP transporter solute-binding subunit [Desulfovibrio sp.]